MTYVKLILMKPFQFTLVEYLAQNPNPRMAIIPFWHICSSGHLHSKSNIPKPDICKYFFLFLVVVVGGNIFLVVQNILSES